MNLEGCVLSSLVRLISTQIEPSGFLKFMDWQLCCYRGFLRCDSFQPRSPKASGSFDLKLEMKKLCHQDLTIHSSLSCTGDGNKKGMAKAGGSPACDRPLNGGCEWRADALGAAGGKKREYTIGERSSSHRARAIPPMIHTRLCVGANCKCTRRCAGCCPSYGS